MCGIVGYMGEVKQGVLSRMLKEIGHRGPDARGVYEEKNLGLGNNRLAIIDLSPLGHQPMFDHEKSLCIVYNGELYNFKKIRDELRHKYSFKSKSDTEVVLYAYKEWGPNCLQKFNGMYSFVIFDKKKHLLFGARDRLGEKPLKYYHDKNLFAFSSEIKGLLPALPQKPEMDPVAINHYLTLQYVPAPYTGFKKISKLPAAHYFIFQNGKLQIKKYWDLSFTKKMDYSEAEWEDLLYEKLKDSVTSRMISDVPVGVFLSGGLDSSAVVALASSSSSRRIKTFSMGFENNRFDESYYAGAVAKQFNTDHHQEIVTKKDLSDSFEHLADYYDEPFADNSALPMLALAKMTGKYVKVALSGDGGDENFAGYNRYTILTFWKWYQALPKRARHELSSFLSGAQWLTLKYQFFQRSRRFAMSADLPFFKRYLYYSCFFDNQAKQHLYTKVFKKQVKDEDTFSLFKSIYKPELSQLDNALATDIHSYLPEDLLFKSDIATMAFSVEGRSPFLNHELMEFTATMPSDLKLKFFQKKYILKKLMHDKGLLGDDIIYRKKQGFVSPIDEWIRNDFKKYAIDILLSEQFIGLHIFTRKSLETYLLTYFQNNGISSNEIFSLLALAMWSQKYL